MPTLLDNLDAQPVESWNRPVNTGAAERLRTTMAACRVQFTWWGVQRTLTAEQKAQAAQAFDAEGEFLSADGITELDELLKSFGPYAVEPAVLVTNYEDEESELIVAGSDAESREMLSRHRLDQIEVLLRDVTPADRAKLVEKLQALRLADDPQVSGGMHHEPSPD